jgi:hypothetical protein
MKMILEIPDDLCKRAQAMAAMRGESLQDLVVAALEHHLEQQTFGASRRGWRNVFGQASREEVESVDAVIAEEFGRIHPEE